MQIVIPMSGTGERFRAAGYATCKPLIEVDGLPIIEHVIRLFPGAERWVFIINRQHAASTDLPATLARLAPNAAVRVIDNHKLGPVHAVLAAGDLIDDGEPVIVNYCDFSMRWDYREFARQVAATAVAGAIPAYRGFHPHLLGSTMYATLQVDGARVLQVREKGHFTGDRFAEFASTGTYYFASGRLAKLAMQEQVARGLDTSGEYYVSLAYNLLIQDGLPVSVFEVDKFLQWGTPQDLREYLEWSRYFARPAAFAPRHPLGGQVLLPMAGRGQRFRDAGYRQAKPLIEVQGVPMAVAAARTLPVGDRYLAVARSADLAGGVLEEALRVGLPAPVEVQLVNENTSGQAATCLLVESRLDLARPLTIGPCDSAVVWDETAFSRQIADAGIDAVVFTFRDHPPANRDPASYGWVAVNAGGRVTQVAVKRAPCYRASEVAGITGVFWFRRAAEFVRAARRMIEQADSIRGEFYVDQAMAHALQLNMQVAALPVDHYICWGTPNELETYQYWQETFSTSQQHPQRREPAGELVCA